MRKLAFSLLILVSTSALADVAPQDVIGATVRKDSTSTENADCFATSCQGIDSDCGKLTPENAKEIESKTQVSK